MFDIDWYSIFYDVIAYIIAARSLMDEILYKLGFKRRIDVSKDLPQDLEGHVALVTGGTRGLGLTVVRELIAKKCLVVVATSQNSNQFPALESKIYDGIPAERGFSMSLKDGVPQTGGALLHPLDLSDLYSVEILASSFKKAGLKLNYLICNAGIMFAPKSLTSDGFESHFAINYLGHCMLIRNLLKIIFKTSLQTKSRCRIINVSSSTHQATKFKFEDPFSEKDYSSSQAYAQSKLAQIMFSARLSRLVQDKFEWKNIEVFSLHPGVVLSDLYEHVRLIKRFPFLIPLIKYVTRTMNEGAETTLYAALSPELRYKSGEYLEDCDVKQPSRYAQDEHEQERLWKLTETLLSKYPCDYPFGLSCSRLDELVKKERGLEYWKAAEEAQIDFISRAQRVGGQYRLAPIELPG